jgi:hypothetical protein
MTLAPSRLDDLEAPLQPLREILLKHPVYGHLGSLEDLHVFMEHHIYAVWDFMSLLKALQARLTGLSIPWVPSPWPFACRMINEIVLGEESDEDGAGGFASHFELYRRAMAECGADLGSIDRFIAQLHEGASVREALVGASAPAGVRPFVEQTFAVIESGDLSALAAAFTFGREDLLPSVFQRIVDQLNEEHAGKLSLFKFYLARHIELDGDEHGPLARRLLEVICGEDEARWESATRAAVASLEARRDLWDAIHGQLKACRAAS